jgi:hypothetical protein
MTLGVIFFALYYTLVNCMTYKDAISPSTICDKNKKLCYCPYFSSAVTTSCFLHISKKYMYVYTDLFSQYMRHCKAESLPP